MRTEQSASAMMEELRNFGEGGAGESGPDGRDLVHKEFIK